MSDRNSGEKSHQQSQVPKPYTLGSSEYFEGFAKFFEHWVKQTKDVKAKAEKEAERIQAEADATNPQVNHDPIHTDGPLPKLRAWNPGSETSIARLSYRLEELPEFYLVTAQIWQCENEVWSYVHPRKRRQSAWEYIFNNVAELKSINNVAIVNTRAPSRDHEDHLIVARSDISEKQVLSLLPRDIDFYMARGRDAQNQKITLKMKCAFNTLTLYKEEGAHHTIYKKSLGLLLKSHLDGMFELGPLRDLSNTFTMAIPSVQGVGHDQIAPLAKGRENPSTAGKQLETFEVHLRSRVSLDATQKVLYMDFDLAAMTPSDRDMMKVISQVFGNLRRADVDRLQPYLTDLLEGVYVQRSYQANATADEKTKAVFNQPFQIRSIMSNEAAKSDKVRQMKDQPQHRGKTEGELRAVESVDTYEYFKKKYNDGKSLEDTYMPVVGDGTGAYFPLQKLATCSKERDFPNSRIFAPALKKLASDLGLLENERLFKCLGEKVLEQINSPHKIKSEEGQGGPGRRRAQEDFLKRDHTPGEEDDLYDFKLVDPIKFYL